MKKLVAFAMPLIAVYRSFAQTTGTGHIEHAKPPVAGLLGMGTGLLIFLALTYFLPITVAVIRKSSKTLGVTLLNIFLGWTVLGWVASLIWAFTSETKNSVMLREAAYRNMASGPRI